MPADLLVKVRLQPAVQERAEAVLERIGLSLADAVALMLERTAQDGVLPFAVDPEHDAWFRRQVQEALDDPRPPLSSGEATALFATARRAVQARIQKA